MTPRQQLDDRRLAAYACGALPLALLSLPVYLHMPKFYSETFGLDLATLGGLLLVARAFDALQDPVLGHLSDVAQTRGVARLTWFWLGTPLLLLGTYGLCVPPVTREFAGHWLVLSSLVIYLAMSVLQINYHAHGAELTHDPVERTRVTAWREGATLIGILLGASLPAWFGASAAPRDAFREFAVLVCAIALVAHFVTLRFSPPADRVAPRAPAPPWYLTLQLGWRDPAFRRLLLIYVFNGMAVGSSRVDLQACKLEYSIVSPK